MYHVICSHIFPVCKHALIIRTLHDLVDDATDAAVDGMRLRQQVPLVPAQTLGVVAIAKLLLISRRDDVELQPTCRSGS